MTKIFVFLFLFLFAGLGSARAEQENSQQYPGDEARKLLSGFLEAMSNPESLAGIPRNSLNYKTRHCVEYPCTSSLPENIELKDKNGKALNQWAQGLYDSDMKPCSTSKGCQWMIWTAAKPWCEKYPCVPQVLELTAAVSWDPPYKLTKKNTPRDQFIYLRVPRELFLKDQVFAGKTCLDRNPPHTLIGLGIDGKPLCIRDTVTPLLKTGKDSNPYRDLRRPDHPMFGFEVGNFPYVVDEELRKLNILAQIQVWALATHSVYASLEKSGCIRGGCKAGQRLVLEMIGYGPLTDPQGGINSILHPCLPGEECPWKAEVTLARACRGPECLEDLPVQVSLSRQLQKKANLNLILKAKQPEIPPQCPEGLVLKAFDAQGTPVCWKGT